MPVYPPNSPLLAARQRYIASVRAEQLQKLHAQANNIVGQLDASYNEGYVKTCQNCPPEKEYLKTIAADIAKEYRTRRPQLVGQIQANPANAQNIIREHQQSMHASILAKHPEHGEEGWQTMGKNMHRPGLLENITKMVYDSDKGGLQIGRIAGMLGGLGIGLWLKDNVFGGGLMGWCAVAAAVIAVGSMGNGIGGMISNAFKSEPSPSPGQQQAQGAAPTIGQQQTVAASPEAERAARAQADAAARAPQKPAAPDQQVVTLTSGTDVSPLSTPQIQAEKNKKPPMDRHGSGPVMT